MQALDGVQAALEWAYQAFRDMPAPTALDSAPEHDAAQILASLTSGPLRALTAERLGPYGASAMTTIGTATDYRYFLPRILELATHENGWPGLVPAIIAGKLRYGDWKSWPEGQRSAAVAVFEATFRLAIEIHPDEGPNAEQWLCGLARLCRPIGGCLDGWRVTEGPGAALQLARFVSMHFKDVQREGKVSAAYWEDVREADQRLAAAWLASAETRAQLERARLAVSADDIWEIDQAQLEVDALLP